MKASPTFPSAPFTINVLAALALALSMALPNTGQAQTWSRPTYSSPIAISLNDHLIWVVNPSDSSVSVIRFDTNQRLAKIAVGADPQSIALTPDGLYAYVANAAGGNVTIIKITDPALDRKSTRLNS